MKPTRKRRGFTLVELLAAMLGAGMLALTAGVMIVFVYRGWRDSNAAVEMQRDGMVAMVAMNKCLRETSSGRVTLGLGQITVVSTNPTLHTMRFYQSGGSLLYDPDTLIPNNEVRLVDNRVQSFTAAWGTNQASVNIQLSLRTGNESTVIPSVAIAFRN
jgi:type II secretory pathway pseudopilin PulG